MTQAAFLNADKIAQTTGGTWNNVPPTQFAAIAVDNRKLKHNALFVALPGEHVDGHDFVATLQDESQQAAIVQTVQDCGIPQLVTPSPLAALQQIAKMCAQTTDGQKIALTGSVGKTGTKEIIAHILSRFGRTHATSGNYNNHIGLPLTLANMPEECAFIVAEMGMNHSGEIAALTQMARPNIAAITCIADSHIGHFDTIEDIAVAKAEIFSGLAEGGVAVLPRDDAFFALLEAKAQEAGAAEIISFGTTKEADFQLISQTQTQQGQDITIAVNLTEEKQQISFSLGMQAPHWALNTICALAICSACGISASQASTCLADMRDIAGRGKTTSLQLVHGTALLVDDSYNASPESMKASLFAFQQRKSCTHKTIILSDMLELGEYSASAHQELAHIIEAAGISHFIAIGPMMQQLASQFADKLHISSFANAEACLTALTAEQSLTASLGDVILVKGSHGSGAYKIAQHLRQQFAGGGHHVT